MPVVAQAALPDLSWSSLAATEAQAAFLQQEDPTLSDTAAFDQACECAETLHDAWEQFCADFTEMLVALNPSTEQWVVLIAGAGWRNQEGRRTVDASEGEQLLRETLPDTECSFNIWRRVDHIEINNAHHDKPTGGEMYYVYPAAGCAHCGEVFPFSSLKVLPSIGAVCADCEKTEEEPYAD